MTRPGEPTLHLRPASGWLNDPNGICRVDGIWHVFFQFQPDQPVHRDICWGHASSVDLITWQHHPIALRPTPGGIDAAGCWSGCVVVDHGVPTAVYTAVGDPAAGAVAAIARGDATLQTWTPHPEPVAGPWRVPGVTEVRDPFVFTWEGRRYAVQGAGAPGGSAKLLGYPCADLTSWSHESVLLDLTDVVAAAAAPAEIWECPSLVPAGEEWLCVVSTINGAGSGDPDLGVAWMLGDLVHSEAGPRFQARIGGRFDHGPAWYAPHLVADRGRILTWGWLREVARTPTEVEASGWSGLLGFPREVHVRGDRVVMVPAAELDRLRVRELPVRPGARFTAPAFELVAGVPAVVYAGADAVAAVVGSPESPARIFVDGDTVEAFDEHGSLSSRVPPGSSWSVRAQPGGIHAYELGLPAG